jgi:hypothetical protein
MKAKLNRPPGMQPLIETRLRAGFGSLTHAPPQFLAMNSALADLASRLPGHGGNALFHPKDLPFWVCQLSPAPEIGQSSGERAQFQDPGGSASDGA